MKVLHLAAWYPTAEQPGLGVFVREHARSAALHHEVTVWHTAGSRSRVRWEWAEERDAALTAGLLTYRIYHPLPVRGTGSLTYIRAVLVAFAQQWRGGYRPAVIHAHVYQAGLPAVLIGQRYGIPVVITEHLSAIPRRLLSRWQVAQMRYAFNHAAHALPVSRSLQRAIEQYGVRTTFEVVPNVVDRALFYPPAGPRQAGPHRLLFVGGLVPVKGLPHLFEALALLNARRNDWRLDIVGDGPERGGYERQVRERGLGAQVTFHGFRPKAEIPAHMQAADLFVLPSLYESLPCVISEALATGLPVVASDIGGIPEMLDAESGRLATPGDAVGLCTALAAALDTLTGADRGRIALKAQRYGLAEVGAQLDRIYREVVA